MSQRAHTHPRTYEWQEDGKITTSYCNSNNNLIQNIDRNYFCKKKKRKHEKTSSNMTCDEIHTRRNRMKRLQNKNESSTWKRETLKKYNGIGLTWQKLCASNMPTSEHRCRRTFSMSTKETFNKRATPRRTATLSNWMMSWPFHHGDSAFAFTRRPWRCGAVSRRT